MEIQSGGIDSQYSSGFFSEQKVGLCDRKGKKEVKRAIVTGADGFLGSHLVCELLETGYDVVAVVLKESHARNVLKKDPRLAFFECSMEEYRNLENKEIWRDADCLFHFAWAGVSDKAGGDYRVQLDNVRCTCDLLFTVAKLGIKRMVFASSIMEWEHKKAFDQQKYLQPLRNTYHIAKTSARMLLSLYAANMNLDFCPVIISNVYGEGERSARLINTALRKILAGEHMSFTSGEQLYDSIYCKDAVRAIRIVAEQGRSQTAYYIGNSRQKPLKEFLLEMRDLLNPSCELGLGELPFYGVSLDYKEFDTNALSLELGFEPQYTFAQGIKRTARWILTDEGRN